MTLKAILIFLAVDFGAFFLFCAFCLLRGYRRPIVRRDDPELQWSRDRYGA